MLFRNIRQWDWGAILISLLIAIFVWVLDALNRADYTTEVAFPIKLVYKDSNVVAFRPPPETFDLLVEGNGWELMKLKLGMDVEPLQIPLPDPTGMKALRFDALRVPLSEHLSNVTILGALQDSLLFDYDSLVTRIIPLRIDSAKLPLETNYRTITPVRLSADSLRVTLPTSLASGLPDTIWLHLDEEAIDDNFSDWLTIKEHTTPLLRERLVQVKPEQVHVRFGTDLFLRQEYTLPIQVRNYPPDSALVLADSVVRFTCLVRRSNELIPPPDSIFVEADFERWNPSDSTIDYTRPKLSSIYVEPDFRPECIKTLARDTL